MQSIKNIYEKIYDFENLHKAWEEARKGKRYRDDVLIFNRNYEEQLINIQKVSHLLCLRAEEKAHYVLAI